MNKSNKNQKEKICIVSNILFIFSSFPSILLSNQNMVPVIIGKIYSFIQENEIKEIYEMSLSTLRQLADYGELFSSESFLFSKNGQIQSSDNNSLLTLFQDFNSIQLLLSKDKLYEQLYYECLARVISHQKSPQTKLSLISYILSPYASHWRTVLQELNSPAFFENELNSQFISFFLKINEELAKNIGDTYLFFFDENMTDVLKIYQNYNSLIQNAFQQQGPNIMSHYKVKLY